MNVEEYVENLLDFAIWVAKEIFDENWDITDKGFFAEVACRKLVKLGLVEEILVEEIEDNYELDEKIDQSIG